MAAPARISFTEIDVEGAPMLNRSSGGAGKALALTIGAIVLTAGLTAPAQAEPNPCAGRNSDSGTGGTITNGGFKTIFGTWYNCGGGTGADRRRINVKNGADGPCITIGYGSTESSSFNRNLYVPGVPPRYDGWISC
ncbi:hypothetical protein [Herbidospora sp. RD11066]